jgi:hypothetical protein
MDKDLDNEITYRLIGVNANFKYFEQTVLVNPFLRVTL